MTFKTKTVQIQILIYIDFEEQQGRLPLEAVAGKSFLAFFSFRFSSFR